MLRHRSTSARDQARNAIRSKVLFTCEKIHSMYAIIMQFWTFCQNFNMIPPREYCHLVVNLLWPVRVFGTCCQLCYVWLIIICTIVSSPRLISLIDTSAISDFSEFCFCFKAPCIPSIQPSIYLFISGSLVRVNTNTDKIKYTQYTQTNKREKTMRTIIASAENKITFGWCCIMLNYRIKLFSYILDRSIFIRLVHLIAIHQCRYCKEENENSSTVLNLIKYFGVHKQSIVSIMLCFTDYLEFLCIKFFLY